MNQSNSIVTKMSTRELLIAIYQSCNKLGDSMSKPIWLTNEDLTKQLGVSRRTLYQWRQEHKITFYQVNRSIVYKLEDVVKFLEKYKVSCNEEKPD